MRLLRWRTRVHAKYNLVTNDEYDARIPLHTEAAFQYGIKFHAKYIGSMDVPRPTSRVEIVAAMRRIRYEFKARGVKKKKVLVEVSIDGVKVTLRKKKSKKKKERSKLFKSGSSKDGSVNSETSDAARELMNHPIYRIFYVSHDSSDLKIFSYIARDGATNLFRCNVFKSTKKSQAMRIVRTVGQAFEVCHKLSNNKTDNSADPITSESDLQEEKREIASENGEGGTSSVAESSGVQTAPIVAPIAPIAAPILAPIAVSAPPKLLPLLPPPPPSNNRRTPQRETSRPVTCDTGAGASCTSEENISAVTPLSAHHELQLLKEKLEQQTQQTQAAVAQLVLLRDQLAAEQAARCEAQARTHQLLVHNKELLDHITALVSHLQERERLNAPLTPISSHHLTLIPQLSVSAKLERWFSLLPPVDPENPDNPANTANTAAESPNPDIATLTEARNLLLRIAAKKKKRVFGIKFGKRRIVFS